MNRLKSHGLALLGLFLALGMVVSVFIAVRGYQRVRLSNHTITVKGYAERPITSDHGTWSGWFSVEAADLPTAYAALEQDLHRVLALFEELGVPRDTIAASAVDMQPIYTKDERGEATNRVEKYRLQQSVTLEGTDLRLIERLAVQSTSLLQQGVAFQSGSPSYFFSKIDAAKIAMLGEAMKDAKARAAALAENSGAHVGGLVQADQGVFQITAPHSTEVSGYGENDTGSISKVIKAVITAEFRLD